MKILDKYVAGNFIIGYLITAMVLIGLCTLIDLFVNLDEFAEHAEMGTEAVLYNIYDYYSAQAVMWFRDLAGVITVIAAVFSLARMTYNNELVAIMASGVSLKRVIAPIVALSFVSMGLLVIDQELIIPRLAHKLIRSHDDITSGRADNVWFMADSRGSLVCTKKFENDRMDNPTFIMRKTTDQPGLFEVTDIIVADSAVYNAAKAGWDLENGRYLRFENDPATGLPVQKRADFYETNLLPRQIPLKQQEGYKSLLSYRQLVALEKDATTRVTDIAELYLHKHSRITDPIINMVMLLLALPVLVCRDPKMMKSAIMKCFGLVTMCFVVAFACKMFATEEFFNTVRPELWAWAPIGIFLPVAAMEMDSMKT